MNNPEIPAKYSTVMLVDDNKIDNLINERVVKFHHFANQVLDYISSETALDYLSYLQENKQFNVPDIIFLDISLPVKDGFWFVEEFARLDARIKEHCKIVILTNSVNPAEEEKARSNKYVAAYLTKPLKKKHLENL